MGEESGEDIDFTVPVTCSPEVAEFGVECFVELFLDVGFVGGVSWSDADAWSGGGCGGGGGGYEGEEEEEREGEEEEEGEVAEEDGGEEGGCWWCLVVEFHVCMVFFFFFTFFFLSLQLLGWWRVKRGERKKDLRMGK